MLLTTALTCLALNVYYEGRGESDLGKRIIAQTTMNRSEHNRSKVCKEVLRPNQFSWVKRNVKGKTLMAKPSGKSWIESQTIAKKALSHRVITPSKYRNVTHFHSVNVHPKWSRKMIYLGRVGHHHFYSLKSKS